MPDDAVYTHGHHDSVLRSHRWRTAANSAAYLLPHLSPGQVLLDIGCGPGTITLDLAQHVAPGKVTGIDASAAVIAEARADAERLGSSVTFAVGDAYALDLPDASVDVVHAHQVLQHLADPVAALREWRRVCRPGGIIAARDADYSCFGWYPAAPELDQWLSLYRLAARANVGEPDAGRHLLAWAHAAGLRDVTATASMWCFATPDDRAWWAATWAGRVSSSAFGEQLLRDGHATRAEVDAIAAAFVSWADDPDAVFTIPHVEIIAIA